MTTGWYWYQAKQFLQRSTGISMDALHVFLGMLALIIFAFLLRRPVSSWLPWSLVLAVTLLNEASDLWLEQWPSPGMQYGESARDIGLTMLLPTLLMVAVRHLPRLFASPAPLSPPPPSDPGEAETG